MARIQNQLLRLVMLGVASGLAVTAHATNLLQLSYDAETDQIVVEVAYRGSHGNHPFSLDWDQCKDNAFEGPPHQIGAQLLDGQFNDSGPTEFKQTLKFSIAELQCRPAKLTIRTSSGVYRTISVPAASAGKSGARSQDKSQDQSAEPDSSSN
jgi:hypothetical protein